MFFNRCAIESNLPTTPDRYAGEVFTNFSKTEDTQYGFNQTQSGVNQNLTFDFFEPSGDMLTDRPFVLLVPGGSFDSLSYAAMEPLAQVLARCGYAVAIVNYRVFDGVKPMTSIQLKTAIVQAMGDVKAALRFFRQSVNTGNTYGIDPEKMFVIGHSSGSLAGLHALHLDKLSEADAELASIITQEGGIDGDSGNPGIDYELRGLVNLSGALLDMDFVENSDATMLSIHGTDDQIVPLLSDTLKFPVSDTPLIVDGSERVHEKALDEDIASVLLRITNGNHQAPLSVTDCVPCYGIIVAYLFDSL
ncbi:MAG: alpha/beta hydrolase [Microscillaceae bacterium]|nr:alpha/beta hydrolase [Microscillaceae bacterium]